MTSPATQIRPIRAEADHEAAVFRIGQLINAVPGSPEAGELDLLATLIDAYEAKHFPIDPPDPIAAIEFRMEPLGLTRKDMELFIGSRAHVSEVLNRKRGLSLEMIRRLRTGLGIPAVILVA